MEHITKTYLYNFDLFKSYFNIVKLGLTWYTLFFLFLLKNIDCGYSLEPPHGGGSDEYQQSMFIARGGSNEYPDSMFLSRNMKNIRFFYLKIFIFWW